MQFNSWKVHWYVLKYTLHLFHKICSIFVRFFFRLRIEWFWKYFIFRVVGKLHQKFHQKICECVLCPCMLKLARANFMCLLVIKYEKCQFDTQNKQINLSKTNTNNRKEDDFYGWRKSLNRFCGFTLDNPFFIVFCAKSDKWDHTNSSNNNSKKLFKKPHKNCHWSERKKHIWFHDSFGWFLCMGRFCFMVFAVSVSVSVCFLINVRKSECEYL